MNENESTERLPPSLRCRPLEECLSTRANAAPPRFRPTFAVGCFLFLLTIAGCGTLVVDAVYPESLVDSSGRTIFLDDVEAIVDNPELSNEQRRQELRDLGIQDEELIDALLRL